MRTTVERIVANERLLGLLGEDAYDNDAELFYADKVAQTNQGRKVVFLCCAREQQSECSAQLQSVFGRMKNKRKADQTAAVQFAVMVEGLPKPQQVHPTDVTQIHAFVPVSPPFSEQDKYDSCAEIRVIKTVDGKVLELQESEIKNDTARQTARLRIAESLRLVGRMPFEERAAS